MPPWEAHVGLTSVDRPSILPEEIAVDPLDSIAALGSAAHVVVDHELGEFLAADQDDLGLIARRICAGFVAECGGGDEDTLPRACSGSLRARPPASFPPMLYRKMIP